MALKPAAVTEPADQPWIHCAHETCNLRAIVKVKTPTGWANFCQPHYVRFYDDQARKRFTELGLDMLQDETREEWRKRVFAHLRKATFRRFEDAIENTFEDEMSAEHASRVNG